MRKSCSIVLVLAAALVLASARPALSATTIDAGNVQAAYAPGTPFSGYLKVVFDTAIPADSQLKASIRDSTSAQSLSMQPYLSGVSYQYKQYAFTYNITAQGVSNWYEYPEKAFWYRLSAEGTCGNQDCDSTGSCDCADLCGPSPSYPCYWSVTSTDMQSSVNAGEGLKFIFDAAEDITPPFSANSDTRWLQVINTAIQYGVQTTMRMACGSSDYMGQATQPNGWVKRTLQGFEDIPGGRKKKVTIEPFDESSLTAPNNQKFVEGGCSQPYSCGGIYAGTTRLTSGFTANGTTGEIIFDSIVQGTTYIIVYLPPNGNFLCAYTSSKDSKSQSWSSASLPQQASVSYNTPFSKSYSESQLPYVFNDSNRITALVKPPECLAGECQQTVSSYSVAKNPDSTGATIQVSFNTQSRTVSATTSSQEITQKYIKVDVSSFTKLKAPSNAGGYTLDVVLLSSGSEIASQEIPFTVCEDKDGDGYCKADDCNDTNKNLNPGMKELCNGIDEDCDGQIDE
ncbi:MAG TPA: putative metal-binding motif-containing protein, partial [archaeon]|nr:putative metal-binding motif-containing protein [archaeon]